MPRYRRPPLTVTELRQDGPAVKLRDIASVCGLSAQTIRRDIEQGVLVASRRANGKSFWWLVTRSEASRYLSQLGCL